MGPPVPKGYEENTERASGLDTERAGAMSCQSQKISTVREPLSSSSMGVSTSRRVLG